MDDLLPCQRMMLDSKSTVADWRIYRCEIADKVCAISGHGPDIDMLMLVCDECDMA